MYPKSNSLVPTDKRNQIYHTTGSSSSYILENENKRTTRNRTRSLSGLRQIIGPSEYTITCILIVDNTCI